MISSIRIKLRKPPPVAPFIPKTGPSEGSRRHAQGIFAQTSQSLHQPDRDGGLFPSPAFVGRWR
ncbi:MAG: hypothetical protein R3C24_02155 [Cyanobacteriota/Melainabacteria group bacterium]